MISYRVVFKRNTGWDESYHLAKGREAWQGKDSTGSLSHKQRTLRDTGAHNMITSAVSNTCML